jgi:hypothetical protein
LPKNWRLAHREGWHRFSRLAGHVTPLPELADVVSQFQAAPFIPKPSGFWVSHSK